MIAAPRPRILGAALALAGLAAVAVTIGLDPPARQRERRLDARREADLHAIEIAVREYVKRHAELPADLAALAAEPGFRLPNTDPQSGTSYPYAITSPRSYRLCADFATDTKSDTGPNVLPVVTAWAHASGWQCFELTIKER